MAAPEQRFDAPVPTGDPLLDALGVTSSMEQQLEPLTRSAIEHYRAHRGHDPIVRRLCDEVERMQPVVANAVAQRKGCENMLIASVDEYLRRKGQQHGLPDCDQT